MAAPHFLVRNGVDGQIRQKLQNSYAETVTDTQRKWVAVSVGLVALVTVSGKLYSGSSSLPSPAPLLIYPIPEPSVPNVINNIRLDRITVFFKPNTTTDTRSVVIGEVQGSLLSYDSDFRMADIRIAPKDDLQALQRVIDEVDKNPVVRFAAPDGIWQGY
jgi:hypothetical protein